MAVNDELFRVAERAIQSLGLGYDLTNDLDFKYCKWDSRVLVIDERECSDIEIPGGISIPNVSNTIECVTKRESKRISSGVLSFSQMSEQFNQDISLSGNIPSGLLNSAFGFSGSWLQDASSTKALALDGMLITLYDFTIRNSLLELHDQVRQAVPATWDPLAMARFIKKFGTHVVVGVTLGGKDAIYVRQQHPSPLHPDNIDRMLKDIAEKRFLDFAQNHSVNTNEVNKNEKNITFIYKRKGGSSNTDLHHKEWLQTIESKPDIVSVSFHPLVSLLGGIRGNGFVSHAINLYLRYKPPIEELQYFFELQLPRQWAPIFGELAPGSRWKQHSESLQFRLMGPKLYVNTIPVDVGKRPVTGLRLYLEGRSNNCLAIHLQHLSSLPNAFHLSDHPNANFSDYSYDNKYYKKVQWSSFSHICTASVESDDVSIVTGAKLEVAKYGGKKVLFLHLQFSTVLGAIVVKQSEWDNSSILDQVTSTTGSTSTYFSNGQKETPKPSGITFSSNSQKETPKPGGITIGSAVYSGGPFTLPIPVHTPKLQRFVDTTEITRGPQDTPGYWVVSGARLFVKNGKIYLLVKYSLFNFALPPANDTP